MPAIVFGVLFVIAGLWGITVWWYDFISIVRGVVPPMIMVGGLIGVIAGITAVAESHKIVSETVAKEPDESEVKK